MSDNDPIPYILVDRPPKPGDRVHIEFDAEYVEGNYFGDAHVVSFDTSLYPDYRAAVPADSVKVIVEPVKVGDVIDAIEAEKLPADSAVLCETNAATYVRPRRDDGLWHGKGRMLTLDGVVCRVLHIGGQR